MNVSTPDWVKDAVFYQIFPDRFDRGSNDGANDSAVAGPVFQKWGSQPTAHNFMGGDLAGVERRLDYLVELGVNAIYLNPVFAAAANHRYNTYDYYQVDPLLGGNAAFDRFLTAAHGRGIRVVLDGVFNHCGRGFYQFHHLMELGADSPYVGWFHVNKWPINAYSLGEPPDYGAWWNIPSLPKFNTENLDVREFLWGVGTHWLEKGIDGWRLDVPYEIDDDSFWQEFRRRCKAVNPEAYIVGEIWEPAQRWLKGDQFDGQMNYLFTRAVFGYLIGRKLDQSQTSKMGYGKIRPLDGQGFGQELDHIFNRMYHPEISLAQLNMLGSHDTPRLMTLANDDKATAALAFLCQMTVPGAPNIYYGDEIGLTGKGDPDCRKAFPWHDPDTWDNDLLDEIKRLTAMRHRSAALRRGTFRIIHADRQATVYERYYEGERVVVALNGSRRKSVTFEYSGAAGELLHEEQVGAAHGEILRNGLSVTLPPYSGRIWSSTAK